MPPYAGPPVASRSGDAASPLRLLAYLALAITLIVLDDQAGWLARLREQANSLVQPVWALAGLPGMSVPAGFGEAGMPVGLQLIGNYFKEGQLLNAAHRFQQATDFHLQAPKGI